MTKENIFDKLKKCNSTVLLLTMKSSKVFILLGKFTRKSGLTERRLFLFFVLLMEKIVSFFNTIKSDTEAENLKKIKIDFFFS